MLPSGSRDAEASKVTVSGACPDCGVAVKDAVGGWLVVSPPPPHAVSRRASNGTARRNFGTGDPDEIERLGRITDRPPASPAPARTRHGQREGYPWRHGKAICTPVRPTHVRRGDRGHGGARPRQRRTHPGAQQLREPRVP